MTTQSNRPLAFFSRKLSVQHQKYSVTEIELLAIVEQVQQYLEGNIPYIADWNRIGDYRQC